MLERNSLKNSKNPDLIQIKKAKYDASQLITTKKHAFFKEKLSETIGKPKEFWESLQSLGMPNKTVIPNFNAIEEGITLTHHVRSSSKLSKKFSSNLSQSLFIKLPKPPDNYNLKSAIQYYSSCAITADFFAVSTTEKQVLKIVQDIKSSKAAGVDELSGKFLKDSADILAKPVPL